MAGKINCSELSTVGVLKVLNEKEKKHHFKTFNYAQIIFPELCDIEIEVIKVIVLLTKFKNLA